MKRFFLPVAIILVIYFSSCYYDNEEALYPVYASTCDTLNVTFSGTIAPMLSNNCLSCHSTINAPTFGDNIRLENYDDVKANAIAVSGSINHTGSYSPMPKNGGKLKACYIAQFDIWLRDGMLNN